jgi:hypothetical protein
MPLVSKPTVLHGAEKRSTNELEERLAHYQLIGRTIRVCEAGSLKVGIPWLPPTAHVRDLRLALDQSVPEYIRTALIGVPTQTLESYCDDLESWPADNRTSGDLGISLYSPIERYALSIVTFIILSAVAGLTLELARTSSVLSLSMLSMVMGSMFAGTVMLLSAMLSSEGYRRASFCWLISREIQRRHGGDPNNATANIGIYHRPAKPLSNGAH